MRNLAFTTLFLAAILPGICAAQTPEWPEYTAEQRWERSARLSAVAMVAAIAHAKAQNIPLEEFGKWWGDFFAPSWGQPGAMGPFEVVRSMRRNLLMWPTMEFEILDQSETTVTARMTRPWAALFGENGTWYGVTLEEYERINSMFSQRIAEYHGLKYEERREGDKLVMTYSRR